MQAAIICGPALGGLLYTQGPVVIYGCCAALLLLAGVLTLTVRYQHRASSLAANWQTVMAGFTGGWLLANP